MRVGGRQKGSKIKPYTHIVVQPNAPKSRYTFSYHSSEAGANAAVKKYERMVGSPLRVVKQSGKSANTDVMESKTSDLIKKSQAKRGAPGTLKRKVSGKMTIAKAQALKNKPGATTLDKKQANFFINMARARNEEMDQQAESLWANIHAKRRRGEKMRKKGEKGAPTPDQIKRAQAASEAARIPRKKGQPAGSDKHSDLYTDENPKGTIQGLKFATVEDAKASVAKIKKSGRTHAHKIQAAIAMEQRARVMGKTGAAAVYRKFINAMKEKTKQKNEDLNERPYLRTHPTLKNLRIPIRRKSGKIIGLTPKKKTKNEMMTAADAGIPHDTKDMGPRLKTTYMHDRRRRKDKLPVLLKRFRKYMDDNYG